MLFLLALQFHVRNQLCNSIMKSNQIFVMAMEGMNPLFVKIGGGKVKLMKVSSSTIHPNNFPLLFQTPNIGLRNRFYQSERYPFSALCPLKIQLQGRIYLHYEKPKKQSTFENLFLVIVPTSCMFSLKIIRSFVKISLLFHFLEINFVFWHKIAKNFLKTFFP